MSSPRQILLVGGPLNDTVHELFGSIQPAEIGFLDPKDPKGLLMHYYRLDPDGKARYIRTEDGGEVELP